MNERKEGWYWVKAYNDAPWECTYWNGRAWRNASPNHEHYRVGPRIPTPDEGWVTVPAEANADMMEVLTLGNKVTAPRRWRDTIAAAPKP